MIEPGRTYWLVNKPTDVDAAGLASYVARNRWVSPTPQSHRAQLGLMRPGDPIACKSTSQRSSGLPFFSGDNQASVMTIHAVGSVRAVDAATGTVDVEWSAQPEAREWYFWTGIPALWRVRSGTRAGADQMLAFVFEAAPQDLPRWLGDPFWQTRFAPTPGLSWIPFHEEVASRLLSFREDNARLGGLLVGLAAHNPNLAYLITDQFADAPRGPIREIDPFTVMGTFNRSMTIENRQAVAKGIANILGVTAPIPMDFDAIPVRNNQKSCFLSYSKHPSAGDVPALWRIFAAAIAHADAPTQQRGAEFADAYNEALRVRGVKWNLSEGLYWIRPRSYVALDGPTREYLSSRWGDSAPKDGQGYLALLDALGQRMGSATTLTCFPELSYAAWLAARAAEVPHSISGMAYWAARIAESVDQDAVENDYERQASRLTRQARDQFRAGDSTWPATLKRALASTNTINFMFADTVNQAVEANPQAMGDALELVWSDPQPATLDALDAALQGLVGKSTPGNVTALGALLISADDAEGNAAYSTQRAHKWFQLTGFEGPMGSPAARYESLRAFLDQLRKELADRRGLDVTRLQAQGLAWSTTEASAPETWTSDERTALQTWRAGDSEPPRAWLVRRKHASVATWLAEGYVALAASHLSRVPAGSDLKAVTKAVEAGYQHIDYSQRRALAVEYHAFLSRMRPGDVVVTHAQERVHVGRVTGDPKYASGTEDRLRRAVDWESSVARSEASRGLRDVLELQGTVVDLTDSYDEVAELLESGGPVDPIGPGSDGDTSPPKPISWPAELRLPPVTEALAESLHTDVEPLQEIVELLATRKQVVLYGPPGTGKTYLAMALARHLVGEENASHRQLVQFHPSYAYEDFFEGFRPYETAGGQPSFRITSGPLRRMAAEAALKENAHKPFVLIIDEMNRANLAKVFGELYFLLEYRDRSIQLQYSPEGAFKLPENLFLIGTMNTADRSIALLDAAMRRRFAFVELHPEEPPVRGVLARYLAAHGQPDDLRAGLLDALNAAIEDTDRDFKIGPSYLMRAEADSPAGLARIWRHDILPLLEEHYYGRLTRAQVHERFGLASLQPRLAPAAGKRAPTIPGVAREGSARVAELAAATGVAPVADGPASDVGPRVKAPE